MPEYATIPGFNPHDVQGYRIVSPADPDLVIWVARDRALEPLCVTIGDQPVMYANPRGHLKAPIPGDWTSHIEGYFTGGLDNAGAPVDKWDLPLHGTFSLTPAQKIQVNNNGDKITGVIDVTRMVTDPYLSVLRTVEAQGKHRSFVVADTVTAEADSEFMYLPHPNFPVRDGTRFYGNPQAVVASDLISNTDMDTFQVFKDVGKGSARFPPTQPLQNGSNLADVRRENFERCYVMNMEPGKLGFVHVALVAPDMEIGAFLRYRPDDFMPMQQAFQYLTNPRGGSAGLELGSCSKGREYAQDTEAHGGRSLMCALEAGESHQFATEVGFLRGKSEVKGFIDQHGLRSGDFNITRADGLGPDNSHSELWKMYLADL